jgi:hypothetical protein
MRKSDVLLRGDSLLTESKEEVTKKLCGCNENPPGVASKKEKRMKPEDWRGLTPLFYQHVNPYGRFTLDLTQRIPLSLTKIA